jgi:hypothetical protein
MASAFRGRFSTLTNEALQLTVIICLTDQIGNNKDHRKNA